MSPPQFLRVLLCRQQDVNMAGYLRKLSSVPQKAHGMTKSQMQKAAERGDPGKPPSLSPGFVERTSAGGRVAPPARAWLCK